MNMKYMGSKPIDVNDNGEPINKNEAKAKGYTKEYIKVMKDFEK